MNLYYLSGMPQTLTGTFPQSTQDYLMWHHFGAVDEKRNRDLLYVFRNLFSGQHLNARNLSLLIDAYIRRTDVNLVRGDQEKNIQCPVLLMCGHDAPHVDDTVEFNAKLNPELSTWMKLQDCSMVLEEQPGKVAEALRLFIQGLGHSLTALQRRADVHSASSSLSDIPLAEQLDDEQAVHIVENPMC